MNYLKNRFAKNYLTKLNGGNKNMFFMSCNMIYI